jgi:hypothetical protein
MTWPARLIIVGCRGVGGSRYELLYEYCGDTAE